MPSITHKDKKKDGGDGNVVILLLIKLLKWSGCVPA